MSKACSSGLVLRGVPERRVDPALRRRRSASASGGASRRARRRRPPRGPRRPPACRRGRRRRRGHRASRSQGGDATNTRGREGGGCRAAAEVTIARVVATTSALPEARPHRDGATRGGSPPLATGRRARRRSASTRSSSRSRARTTSTRTAARDYLSPFYSPDLESLFGCRPAVLAGVPRALGAAGPAAHLLLLPQGVLPLVLPGPARVRGGRAARRRYRGESRASRSSSRTSHRYFLYFATIVLGFLWYDAVRAFFFRTSDGSLELGVGARLARAARERRRALVLHVRLQLAAPPRRRQARLLHVLAPRADAAHGSGAASRVLNVRHMEWAWISLATRRPRRPLHPARRVRRLPRPADLLSGGRDATTTTCS